jgi:hypothetical protein
MYEVNKYQPSPAKFAITCSHTRTILQTARQENSGKSTASILYRKIYKMSHPIFSAIILPLPAHAQESNPAIHSNTRYLCDYKPLLTVEPAEPAAQGIILIKTANAVITLFSNIHLTDKKWISRKQGFMKANPNMTETVNGMLLFITSILAQWRHYPRLKKCAELHVCRPQEGTWKPPLPQYATTLHAMADNVPS